MTDEEMADKHAEEYRKNFRYYRAWHGQVVNKSPSTIVDQSFKDGFLAGLKAGRPQWHDLRKDPNDLPEKMGLGSKEVYVAYENGVTDFACYRFDKKCWERSEDNEQAVGVIAWCEIPTFDKE